MLLNAGSIVVGFLVFFVQLLVSQTAATQCPLDGIVNSNPQCSVVGDCRGLNCTPSTPFQNYSASYTVTRCADPIQVDLTITNENGEEHTTQFYHSGRAHFGGGVSISVGMNRNATHMSFQAFIYHSDNNLVTLFPETLVPLNPDECMCNSLQSLARKAESIHPIVESNCITTRSCTAVRCDLNISDFAMYFAEMVVLPCENVLEFLVKNQEQQALIEDRFQGPINETKTIFIGPAPFQAEQIIEVQDYSMAVQSYLSGPGIGRVTVIPEQTIILDRTQCDIPEFPTVAMPTRPPPPTSVKPDSSDVCISLSKIAGDVYSRTPLLRCEACSTESESGLNCMLDVALARYSVELVMTRRSLEFSLSTEDGENELTRVVNDNATVRLPAPHGAYVVFGQRVERETGTVGFMLQLRVSFLTIQPLTEELIPFTTITFPPPTNTTAIVVAVIITILGLLAIICVTVLIAVCCVRKKKQLAIETILFQKMGGIESGGTCDTNNKVAITSDSLESSKDYTADSN